jgi:hypothetical protein
MLARRAFGTVAPFLPMVEPDVTIMDRTEFCSAEKA